MSTIIKTKAQLNSFHKIKPSFSLLAVSSLLFAAINSQAADLIIQEPSSSTGEFDRLEINAEKEGGSEIGAWRWLETQRQLTILDEAKISILAKNTARNHQSSIIFAKGEPASIKISGDFISDYKQTSSNGEFGEVTALHAHAGSNIEIGSESSKTRILTIGPRIDAIGAKSAGSSVTINSTDNIVIGSIDFLGGGEVNWNDIFTADTNLAINDKKASIRYSMNENEAEEQIPSLLLNSRGEKSKVHAKFGGSQSLWFGDEQNSANAFISVGLIRNQINIDLNVGIDPGFEGEFNIPITSFYADTNTPTNPVDQVEMFLKNRQTKFPSVPNTNFEVSIENGAQWIYFGVPESVKVKHEMDATMGINSSGEYSYDNGKKISGDELAKKLQDKGSPGGLEISFINIPKRLSNLTLQNAGIVNLAEQDARQALVAYGITEQIWPEVHKVKHNYVRFGDLSGTGGIFRLDIDGDKQNSDMIFIEGSQTGGQHNLQIASISNLDKVPVIKRAEIGKLTDEHKIRFATVNKTENPVTFAGNVSYGSEDLEKVGKVVNYYGNELHTIQLYIGSEPYDPENPDNHLYEERVIDDAKAIIALETPSTANYATAEETDPAEYASEVLNFNPKEQYKDGTNYYLYRIEDTSTIADPPLPPQPPILEAHFGLASWLYGTYLDRLNKRLGEIHYQEGDSGLWIRSRYNETGDRNLELKWGALQIGADRKVSENNRIGFAFELNKGYAKLDHVDGKDRLHGFNLMAYDTWANDKGWYLDLTARWGKVHNKVSLLDPNRGHYSGNYRQSILALSAEAGKKITLNEQHKIFLEPQIQFQWAHIGSTNWKYNSGLASGIKSANSYIGRIGARLGKEWISDQERPYNFYLKADLLREFGNPQKGYLADEKERIDTKWAGHKTWGDFGISTQAAIGKQTWFHLDLEKEIGNGMGKAWQINANIRYTF